MEFEFQESDIIFSDDHHENQDRFSPDGKNNPSEEMEENNVCVFTFEDLLVPVNAHGNSWVRKHHHKFRKGKKKKAMNHSPPVDIPEKFLRSPDNYSDDSYEDEVDFDGGEMIPPHVIVGRRVAGKIASSICTSDGRAMKGRYMSEFRNSILRLTGFLES